jgi:sulfur-oxidizing protein SoxY
VIDPKRRKILKYASVANLATLGEAAGLLKPGVVHAADWNKALFENKNLTAVLAGVSNGVDMIIPSRDIIIKVPPKPESWHVVPVEVTSNIAGTTRIILIRKKPEPRLIADFNLFNGAQGFVSTRVCLWCNSLPCGGVNATVLAIVHANGQVYSASEDAYLNYVGEC